MAVGPTVQERTMKMKEVILRAVSGELSWIRAAGMLGMTARTMRRWKAKFEYAGQGVRTIRKGDCINQRPGIPHREIACSEDFEVLEIVAPADFKTRVVEAPPTKQAAE